MKNILTFFFLLYFGTCVNAQCVMLLESGVLGSNSHIGIRYIHKDSKIGFYLTVGGNQLPTLMGLNISFDSDVRGDFQSNVSWYDKNGTSYQTLPHTPIFTSPEWGNRLLENGECVNTVETRNGELTNIIKNYNLGVVIPSKNNKNLKYRIGFGLRQLHQQGYYVYKYWQHSFKVNKYYDEWGVVNQPSGIFVVEHSSRVKKWEETKYIYIFKNEFNINIAVEYETIHGRLISLGYNTKGGINFGMGFPIL